MAGKLTLNPWKEIWLRPRETIRAIVNFNPKYRFLVLSFVYGLPMALNFAQSGSLAETIPLWSILLASALIAPFVGALGICVCALLLFWTGKWIGGASNFPKIRAAVSWSNVPNIVTIALWCVLVGFFGSQAFLSTFADTVFVGYQAGIIFIVFLLESIVSVWGFIILLRALGEVQGFSIWRALLNVIIPLLLIVIVIWLAGWIISSTHIIAK